MVRHTYTHRNGFMNKEVVYIHRSQETGGIAAFYPGPRGEAPSLVRRQREQRENLGKSTCDDFSRKK